VVVAQTVAKSAQVRHATTPWQELGHWEICSR